MVRASITVNRPNQLKFVYERIDKDQCFNVVRVDSKLHDQVQNVIINVIFDNSIIGEIKIAYGEKPINYHSNKFLDNLV